MMRRRMRSLRAGAAAVVVAAVLCGARRADAQSLGHRIPGALGLGAGTQPPAGVYVADRLLVLHADRAFDRDGNQLDLPGFALDARANVIGLAGYVQLAPRGPYLGAAAAVPLAGVSVNRTDPIVNVDRYGLGDVYVQPFRLGWRLAQLDVVTSYAFYLPTGLFEPRGAVNLGSGAWIHEFAAGGAVYFTRDRTVYVSALASYLLNQRRRGIDIVRGDVLQVQGGFGVRIARLLDVGLAGYALWQVVDDRGSDVPASLRGARDQTYGLGPEVSVLVPQINGSIGLRYEHDFGVRARPEAQVLVCSVTLTAWRPAK